jgi:hypothetical protein
MLSSYLAIAVNQYSLPIIVLFCLQKAGHYIAFLVQKPDRYREELHLFERPSQRQQHLFEKGSTG